LQNASLTLQSAPDAIDRALILLGRWIGILDLESRFNLLDGSHCRNEIERYEHSAFVPLKPFMGKKLPIATDVHPPIVPARATCPMLSVCPEPSPSHRRAFRYAPTITWRTTAKSTKKG
jgi:hypothetical protein